MEVFNAWAAFEARKASNLTAAMAVLTRGRELYPQDPSLLQSVGTLQRRAKDPAGARESFKASIAMEPRGATYVAYALLEADEGNVREARRLFEEGVAADPSHGPLHSARAKFEAAHGGADAARDLLRTSVAKYPCATLWHGWGKLEERAGNLKTVRVRWPHL